MELACKIVEDLMPLYTEGLASEESREAVEAHLAGCPRCKARLDAMSIPAPVPRVTAAPLEKINAGIQKRRWLTGMFCFFLAASLLFGLLLWLYQPTYYSAGEAVAGTAQEDGGIRITLYPGLHPEIELIITPEGRKEYGIMAYRRNWDRLFSRGAQESLFLEGDNPQIWYCSPDGEQEDVLLWGQRTDAGRVSLPWLGMRFYVVLALGGMILCALLFFVFRKSKAGAVFGVLAILAQLYIPAAFLATGGTLVVHGIIDRPISFMAALVLAILATGALFSWIALYQIRRKSR